MTPTRSQPAPGLGRPLGQFPELDTPTLVVEADVLQANLERMAHTAAAAGLALRPHTKTHKSLTIARKQLELGARGITVAKPSEAVVFWRGGIRDIFLAYPPVGQHKLDRIAPLIADSVLTVGLDDVAVAEPLGKLSLSIGRTVPVMYEVDVGMRRAGRRWGSAAADEALRVARTPGIDLVGVFTHEGHAHDHDPDQLDTLATQVAERIVETAELIRGAGQDCEIVSVGSSLTAAHMHADMGLTEVRPGAYVFADGRTVQGAAANWHDCALTVLTAVVSRPDPFTVVIDAGTKTLSPATAGECGHGLIANRSDAQLARLSEEHGTVILGHPDADPAVGERLHIVPARAGLVVNTHHQIHLGRRGELVRVVPIEAMLHST